MNVGLVGLGKIGTGVASNVLKCGFTLTVYDIDKDRVRIVEKLGARGVNSPMEVAATSDIVLLSLPSPSISEKVVMGEDGLLSSARRGLIIVEMSTVHPGSIKNLAKQANKLGVEVIESPVTGGSQGANRGTLHLIVGGDKDTLKQCRPVLESFSRMITHVGKLGSGSVVKLINNVLSIHNQVGVFQAFLLAAKSTKEYGVSLQTVYDVINEGTGSSWILDEVGGKILAGEEVGDNMILWEKDIGLALQMASELGISLPIHTALFGQVMAWITMGITGDSTEVAQYLGDHANVKILGAGEKGTK